MSSEEYSTESSADDDQPAVDFSGNLKAAFAWDASSKQLAVRLRQSVETGRKVEFKYKGYLDTSTGQHSYCGHLRKNFYTSTPITMQRVMVAAEEARRGARPSDPDIDPNRFLPAGVSSLFLSDWVLSPGLSFDSGNQKKLQYALSLRKTPQFLRHSPKLDSWLSGKAVCEVDPKTAEVSSTASVRLKVLRYNITDKQDLKVSLGLDVTSKSWKWSQAPYLKLSENNFAVKLHQNKWSLLYEL